MATTTAAADPLGMDEAMARTRRALIAVGAATSLALAGLLLTGAEGRATGTLELRGVFRVAFEGVACPEGTPITTVCYTHTGQAAVRGLGTAKDDYTTFVEVANASCPDWRFTGVLSVAGKGEIDFVAVSPGCVNPDNPNGTVNYTVTGGTGAYAGASGTGRIVSGAARETGPGVGSVKDTWTGTLDVPGLTFDVTPPILSAAANKTILAPTRTRRIRVTYGTPTAEDAVDGALPVTCRPRSGSLFRIGRTLVRCAATDSSANTGGKTFTVTVRRRA
jgi:HYR domain